MSILMGQTKRVAKQRQYHASIRHKYGIDRSDVEFLLEAQDWRCAICKRPFYQSGVEPDIDHNHRLVRIRGLLCRQCNNGIGLFNEQPELLREAARYVSAQPTFTRVASADLRTIPRIAVPIGFEVGDLIVIGDQSVTNGLTAPCRCVCGRVVHVRVAALIHGRTLSCGCHRGKANRHGEEGTKLYAAWWGMKTRCDNPRNAAYSYIGGRGITYVPEWAVYEAFRDWAISNGYDDDLELGRQDPDGDYTPDNCRWFTAVEGKRHTRRARMLTAFGETKAMSAWAEDPRCAVNYNVLNARISRMHWDVERAILTPAEPRKPRLSEVRA